MLKITPHNYLTLIPSTQDRLQATFFIANPSSSGSAPFKIKCNRPELFKVRPHVGVLVAGEELQVHVSSQHSASSPLIGQAIHDIRFKIEYAILPNEPQDLTEALHAITDQNKRTHKLFLSEKAHLNGSHSDAESCVTVLDDKEKLELERFSPQDLPSEERFQYLKQEIDRAEKQRSQVIMASRPPRRNWALIAIIFILALLAGNFLGKTIGLGNRQAKKAKKKQRQYGYFGLEKWWAGEQVNQPQEALPWWKIWG